MASKTNPASRNGEAPVEVFRQFAWHLAGSLAAAGAKSDGARGPGKPAKATGRR